MATARRLDGVWLGRRDYESVHELQRQLLEARKRQQVPDTVLFVEHDPVITFGRAAKANHLRAASSELARLGVSVVETGRGGDVTLHAPGQLVCYPIIDLNPDRRDVRRYVNDLTRCMQQLARQYGVGAGTQLERVASDAACGAGASFYFSQDLSKIFLCPSTCTTVQADPMARIAIDFGCLGS